MLTADMTLLYAVPSPFARQVLILLHETGQLAKVNLNTVQVSPVNPSAEVVATNPSGKIPTLLSADGMALYDSRVILEYLDSQHSGTPLLPREGKARWDCLTKVALADALLDAALLVRYELALRPAELHWPLWLDNQREKIQRALAFFETFVPALNAPFDLAAIALASALGYLDFRFTQLAWRESCPRLAKWYAEISLRPSMQQTLPE